MSQRDPFAHRLQYVVYRLLAAACGTLPPRARARAGRVLGQGVLACVPFRRRVAAENLAAAFGEDPASPRVREVLRESFAAGGELFLELLLLDSAGHLVREGVDLRGLEHLAAARAAGRGVLLFTGHLGNWEFIGPRLVAEGVPVTLLVGRQRNRSVDAWLNRARAALGVQVVPLAGGGRVALSRLRAGEAVGMLVDQRLRRGGVLVPFFGRPAATSPAAARLALASGASVVPVSITRHAGGVRHTVRIAPALAVARTGDRDADVLALTRAMTAELEGHIREAPGQYYWFHRRWRPPSDRPAGEGGAPPA